MENLQIIIIYTERIICKHKKMKITLILLAKFTKGRKG